MKEGNWGKERFSFFPSGVHPLSVRSQVKQVKAKIFWFRVQFQGPSIKMLCIAPLQMMSCHQPPCVSLVYIIQTNRDVIRKKWSAAFVHSTVARAESPYSTLPAWPLCPFSWDRARPD